MIVQCADPVDYPMSSSLSAEKTPLGSRAVLVLSVFSNIGLGAITSSIVYLILLVAFKESIHQDIRHLEWVWRLLLGIGLIPCALTLYARLTMKETKPYEKCNVFGRLSRDYELTSNQMSRNQLHQTRR